MGSEIKGETLSLRLCETSRAPMKEVNGITLITGEGIEGDRHRCPTEKLKYSSTASVYSTPKRQVLLMDIETLNSFDLQPGQIRENITIMGIKFSEIHDGDKFYFDSGVILEITGDCDPCAFIEDIRKGLRAEIDGKRGLLAYVENGGQINIGDRVGVVLKD